jgi:cadmium resistance protein CadD (predicted permease)
MSWLLSLLLIGIAAFAITNIDDMFLLIFFFSQVGPDLKKYHIILGQYLGFVVLLVVSMLGFFGALIIPGYWIGLLGLYPVCKGLLELRKRLLLGKSGISSPRLPPPVGGSKSLFGALLAPQTYGIATITIGNGGDNLSVYIPLFAQGNGIQMFLLIILFLILVGIWCAVAYALTHHPPIARVLRRFAPAIFPVFLVVLGLFILSKSGTLAWLLSLLTHR